MTSPDFSPRPWAAPAPPEALLAAGPHALDDGPGSREAGQLLLGVLERLRRRRSGGPPEVLSLAALAADARARLAETLGEGEVTATVTGRHVFQLRETGLPGLWWVRDTDAQGRALGEYLEVADVPAVVRAADREATCAELSIGVPPDDAMNVPAVLAELQHRQRTWAPGVPNHVVSFTLLPMSEGDMRHLERQLLHGPVLAESWGYGHCRVELTGHRHVWSVQYFNAAGALVLDTVEVGDVPAALVAGAEDFEDSARRLAELLGV
jgi:hydrogenase-1 operon protein HyaF